MNIFNQKGFAQLLMVALLTFGIGVGVFLTQRQTNLLPKASENTELTAPYLALKPQISHFNKGCSYSLNIELDTGDHLVDGADVRLFFDNQKVKINSVDTGTAFPQYEGETIVNVTGSFTLSGLAPASTPFSGKGHFAKINFEILPEAALGPTIIRFDFDPNDKFKTTDSNVVERTTVVDVLNTVGDGTYEIESGSCTEPSPIPSPSQEASPSASISPTIEPTPTATASAEPSQTPHATQTPEQTASPSAAPTDTSEEENVPITKDECKKGGWQAFTNPSFKNQGQCVSFVASKHKQGFLENLKDTVENFFAN